MSADKRKTILIGFAGLAVVLVAIIAIVSPSFRSEDATGAIGAVQKHRAPQITKQDVVLGDENQKQEQKVLYADYLADAATLKTFSRDVVNARNNNDVRSRIDAAQRDVQSRFRGDFDAALGFARKLAESEAATLGSRKQAAITEIDSLGVRIQAVNLSNEDMASLSVRLDHLATNLGMTRIEARNLDKANLDIIRRELSEIDQVNLAARIRVRADYAEAMAKQAMVLSAAENELATLGKADVQALEKQFALEATNLEARAQSNMKSALQAESDEIAALGKMVDSFNQLNVRSSDAAQKAQLDAVTRDFRSHAAAAQADLNAMAHDRASYAAVLADSDSFATQARSLMKDAEALGSRVQK